MAKDKKNHQKVNRELAIDKEREIDNKIDSRVVSDEDRENRILELKKIEELDNKEKMDNMQRVKGKWCGFGDEISRMFHSILTKARKKSCYKGYHSRGRWTDGLTQVKNEFLSYFSSIFSDINFSVMSQTDRGSVKSLLGNAHLERPFCNTSLFL